MTTPIIKYYNLIYNNSSFICKSINRNDIELIIQTLPVYSGCYKIVETTEVNPYNENLSKVCKLIIDEFERNNNLRAMSALLGEIENKDENKN